MLVLAGIGAIYGNWLSRAAPVVIPFAGSCTACLVKQLDNQGKTQNDFFVMDCCDHGGQSRYWPRHRRRARTERDRVIVTYGSNSTEAEAAVSEIDATGVRAVALPLDLGDTKSL